MSKEGSLACRRDTRHTRTYPLARLPPARGTHVAVVRQRDEGALAYKLGHALARKKKPSRAHPNPSKTGWFLKGVGKQLNSFLPCRRIPGL